jgi:hypothetical protein
MRFKAFSTELTVMALSTAALVSPAFAQSGQPGLYAFHTGPTRGGCPGLDWHVTLEPGNTLNGFVAWDQGKHIAKVAGSINTDRTFQMEAQEVGGAGRKATVKGSAAGSNINVVISGTGTACDGVNLTIPRVVGGLGGGGG